MIIILLGEMLYGLANTLLQTAILKPACKSKKVKNLFYTGSWFFWAFQLTLYRPGSAAKFNKRGSGGEGSN